MHKQIIIAAIVMAVMAPAQAKLSVGGRLDRQSCTLDEQLEVSVEVSGPEEEMGDKLPDPQVEPSTDFKLLGITSNTSSSSSIQIINGKMTKNTSKIVTFSCAFKPLRTGQLKLPLIRYVYKDINQPLNSPPISVTAESPEAGYVQVKAWVSKSTAYIGEQISFTLEIAKKAGTNVELNAPQPDAALQKDFWITNLNPAQGVRGKIESRADGQYEVYRFTYALVPLNAGPVTIARILVPYRVLERSQSRRRSVFDMDPFGGMDDFFGGVRAIQKEKSTSPVTLNVLAVPNPPADFTGSVGQLKLKHTVDRTKLKAGEALTLNLTISGNIQAKSIKNPKVPEWKDFEAFEPEISTNSSTAAGQVEGEKTFKYVLVPRKEGHLSIPEITYTYFDPRKNGFAVLTMPAIALDVEKGDLKAEGSRKILTKEEIKMVGSDIRYIRTETAHFTNQDSFYYQSGGYYLLQCIPFLGFFFALIYRRQQVRLKADAHYARKRQAGKKFKKVLTEAHHALKAQDTNRFYGALSKALRDFVGDKFNVAGAGITEIRMRELFSGKNGTELGDRVWKYLEQCDFGRFSSAALNRQEMEALLGQAEELMSGIEKI